MRKPTVNEIKPDISKVSVFLYSTPKFGKEQPVSEPILTSTGWKKMRDIQVGDMVYAEDGKTYPVTGVYPQGVKDVYKVTFTDGTSTRCGKDHLWTMIPWSEAGENTPEIHYLHELFFEYISDLNYDREYIPRWKLPEVASFKVPNTDIEYKAAGLDRLLKSVEMVGQEESQCIQVDSPSHLYITKDFIPTHNTSLFHWLTMHKYADPESALVIKCGSEDGTNMLEGAFTVSVKTWIEFEDVCRWLFKQEWVERDAKGKVISTEPYPHHIKMVSIDTIDELVKMAEERCVQINNAKSDQYKKVSSINGAMGGFTEGFNYTCNNILAPAISKLKENFGLWVLGHSKSSNLREKGEDKATHKELTSSVRSNYGQYLENVLDLILIGWIDFGNKIDEDGNLISSEPKDDKRWLYLRGAPGKSSGARIEADAIPERIEFTKPDMGAEVLKVLEDGLKKSKEIQKQRILDIRNQLNAEPRVITSEPEPSVFAEPEPELENISENETEEEDIFNAVEDSPLPTEEELRDAVMKCYRNTKDKTVKSSIQSAIKEKGTWNDLSFDEVKALYDQYVEGK